MISGSAAQPEPTISVGGEADARPTFAQVYESQFAFVWRSARRLGTPEASLDDAVQEIFVIVHRSLPRFEGRSSLRTWLFGIVLNVVRAQRRALRTNHPHALRDEQGPDPDALTDRSPGPDDALARSEAARVVDRLLDDLDDEKRAVFVLAELEQMTAPDIAAALSVPLNTVYSRLRLARQAFSAAAARERARDGWRSR